VRIFLTSQIILVGALLLASPALAQYTSTSAAKPQPATYPPASLPTPPASSTSTTTAPSAVDRASFLQGLQTAMSFSDPNAQQKVTPQQQQINLGSADDPNSPLYKANALAAKARQQREDAKAGEKIAAAPGDLVEVVPPPAVERLQNINEAYAGKTSDISDDPINKQASLDTRKEAQKEAALSYGARGGLAKRNYEIMESMKGFDASLDRVFNFRALLVKTASGLLIEPPIVKESIDAMVITAGGDEAAVADKVFDINKKAKIVSAPRDWRQYLIQTWAEVPPPPRILWPKNKAEQADWNAWVSQGWKAGDEQAEQIFESNVNRLVADYNGMVRYRMLLAQGMISAPYAMHEDRGVTGDKNQMRVGDRAVRITGPSQFLTGAELWKPADR
jgi:defect-in-organelle-trafficking protein DotC